jgi:hypothetical protein
MVPAGGGASVMCNGELGMLWLAQALSNTLHTTGARGELNFFIVSFRPRMMQEVAVFVVLLQL